MSSLNQSPEERSRERVFSRTYRFCRPNWGNEQEVEE